MPRAAHILIAALALALSAAPAALGAERFFRTPTRNINCVASSTQGPGPYLRCDVNSLNDRAYVIRRSGRAHRVHITDSAYSPSARVLGYGRGLSFAGFRCSSAQSGLTCRNGAGHGFFLSRSSQRTF